jgi:hypothetical protein
MGVPKLRNVPKMDPQGSKMWISREKLWIKRPNWGKLTLLFEFQRICHPQIWGASKESPQITFAIVGWGKRSV